MQPAILTEKLSKAYGRRLGIADLDLEVRPGEVFGFIGPNGAGKTTTIRLLLGLIRPTGGRAMVLGRDSRRDSVAVHRAIGYLPGDFGLDVRMTGRQLIRYFSRLRADAGGGKGGAAVAGGQSAPGLGRATSRTSASETSAQDLADRLGLDLDVPMGRLSRGNRQKIALVQALYHRPPLLILDEPSTGLDPLVQDTFLQILREARDEGRTVFLSSHVLSEVERVCDRIGIVRAGRLAALETTESLLEKRRKRVSLVFAAPVDASLFAALPGVSDVWVDGPRLSLRLHDGIDAVIKLASRYTVLDLVVENPTLDEVFMSYYDESRPWQA
jgi:ABC-2 type transport system ATP-binding protein